VPCFYVRTLSRTVPATCTDQPHSKMVKSLAQAKKYWRLPEFSLISVRPQQSLSLLIGVLSKSGEHTNDHHHCPMSVFILTTSGLEANLENQRMSSV
jgi:hypothetical protein